MAMPTDQGAGLGMPQQGAGGAPADLMGAMGQQLQGSQSMFDKMEQGAKMLKVARERMDHLGSLGDQVSPSDVVDMGGALVGEGLSPTAVAALLGQMPPEGGAGLASWVQQQEATLAQREQMHQQVHSAMQHHLGVNALRMLAGHHLPGEAAGPDGAAAMQQPGMTAPGAGLGM